MSKSRAERSVPELDLLENNLGYAALLSLEGRAIRASGALRQASGLTCGAGTSSALWEALWWGEWQGERLRIKEAFRRAAAGESLQEEFLAQAGSGDTLALDVTLGPVRDKSGRIAAVAFFAIDITDRKRAEDALRWERDRAEEQSLALLESQTQLQALFDNSPLIIVVKDCEGHWIEANRNFYEVTGLTPEEVIGRKSWDVLPKEMAESGLALDTQVLKTRRAAEAVTAIPTNQGIRDFLEVKFPIFGADGSIRRIGIIATDISEQVARERSLRESQARLAEAQRVSHCGSWDWNIETGAYSCSEELCRIYGLPEGETIGSFEAMLDFTHPDDRDLVRSTVAAALESRQVCMAENRIVRHDGQVRSIQGHGEVAFDARKRPTRMYGTMLDVTERRALELRLQQSQKLEALGHLTGGIAHDFNNLMSVVGCNLELLELELEPGSRAGQLVGQAYKGVELARDLTQQLLAFARRQTLRPRVVKICSLLELLLPMLEPTLGMKVRLVCLAPEQCIACRVDPAQMETTILNLCINARDAMPAGGEILIEVDAVTLDPVGASQLGVLSPGDYLTITLRDQGSGMTPEVMERAFEPFFTTKAHAEGTGLGLSMVLGFIRQSGGDVVLESELGKGTSIRLYLPRWQSKGEPETADCPPVRGVKDADGADSRAVVDSAPEAVEGRT